jgi:hypothetical protein
MNQFALLTFDFIGQSYLFPTLQMARVLSCYGENLAVYLSCLQKSSVYDIFAHSLCNLSPLYSRSIH